MIHSSVLIIQNKYWQVDVVSEIIKLTSPSGIPGCVRFMKECGAVNVIAKYTFGLLTVMPSIEDQEYELRG